jgi:hypothetical protein
MVKVIADGRGHLRCARRPNLSVAGLWCDFTATGDLVDNDRVRPAWPAPTGVAAPAVLTGSGPSCSRPCPRRDSAALPGGVQTGRHRS